MQIKFALNIAPFSVNRMYYRDRRHKTQDYRDWELSVLEALRQPTVQVELKKLREAFDEKLHCLVVKFDFQFPTSTLYNKQGTISSRAEDLSNVEKPLLDLICLPKVHVQSFPYGVPNLNVDDKVVVRLISSKTASTAYKILVTVRTIPLVKPAVGP